MKNRGKHKEEDIENCRKKERKKGKQASKKERQ